MSLSITKGAAIEECTEAFRDVHDMDVPYERYVLAVIECLEKRGLTFAREPDAPCPHCGKPADTRSCSWGGCPLGADL